MGSLIKLISIAPRQFNNHLVYFLKDNRLTHGKKDKESLIDEEASWLKYEEELNEKKPFWIVNSATADALVARDRAALGVSEQLAAISSDWLDTIE